MGESHFAPWPVGLYGVVLLLTGGAYVVLTRALIARHGTDSALATALGRDAKAWMSLILYGTAILGSFVYPRIACWLYVVVAIMWLVPDRRIERAVARRAE